MSELRTKLVSIQTEKNTKLTPENLREGITCLGVTGILKEGLDTSDATAVSNDIAAGKTAYVNGAKIEGILLDRRTEDALWVNTDLDRIDVTSQPSGFLVLAKSIWDEDCVISKETSLDTLVHYSDLASAIELTSDQIVEGNTVLGINGTGQTGMDTSDATATPGDIAYGKTAYVNGEKVEGTINDLRGYGNVSLGISSVGYTDEVLSITTTPLNATLVDYTNKVIASITASKVASAIGLTANKIQAGNTILGINGTAPVTFATIEEMNNNTAYPENTFAIVYGTEYVGTYKLDNGVWTQIGEATDNSEMMRILNETDGDILEYEGNGGTDEEINAVLEDILTNPNIESEIGPEENEVPRG